MRKFVSFADIKSLPIVVIYSSIKDLVCRIKIVFYRCIAIFIRIRIFVFFDFACTVIQKNSNDCIIFVCIASSDAWRYTIFVFCIYSCAIFYKQVDNIFWRIIFIALCQKRCSAFLRKTRRVHICTVLYEQFCSLVVIFFDLKIASPAVISFCSAKIYLVKLYL